MMLFKKETMLLNSFCNKINSFSKHTSLHFTPARGISKQIDFIK